MPAITPEGQQQRRRILHAAMELFTASGFRGASLDRVAAAVGISRQGVLHYFPSKTHLLLGVLELRDEETTAQAEEAQGLVDGLLRLVTHNQRSPDLTRLYTVLSAESVAPEHLGHAPFRERYRTVRALMAEAVRAEGGFAAGLDADEVATLLVAVMDGLQIQFLLEPEAVDMVAPLRTLLALLDNPPAHALGDGGGAV